MFTTFQKWEWVQFLNFYYDYVPGSHANHTLQGFMIFCTGDYDPNGHKSCGYSRFLTTGDSGVGFSSLDMTKITNVNQSNGDFVIEDDKMKFEIKKDGVDVNYKKTNETGKLLTLLDYTLKHTGD